MAKEFTYSPCLFAEDKYAGLAGETDFLYLSTFTQQNGVIRRLGAAVFPAALGLSNNFLAILNRGFVAINQQAVFARFEVGLAELRGLRNVDGLAERLCKYGHGHRKCGEQCKTTYK